MSYSWHILERVARRKLKEPLSWRAHSVEALGSGGEVCVVKGCVSSGVFTKGPRKGRPRYDGVTKTEAVTQAEHDSECLTYQEETGHCWRCQGTGQEAWGWSAEAGTNYRACRHCSGAKTRPETLEMVLELV